MSDETRDKDKPAEIEEVEISPLSDEDLEAVPGGYSDECISCITTGCCTSEGEPI
jgi:hypothetical protein